MNNLILLLAMYIMPTINIAIRMNKKVSSILYDLSVVKCTDVYRRI
ncbi:MAG: hypothetical protein Q7S53_02640 [bacterium]|nr:hypothetical protein [bacterium]